MENINIIDAAIDFLNDDSNLEELIDDIVYEQYEDYLDDPDTVYDENEKFIYQDVIINLLKKKFDTKALSDENIQTVLNIVIKYILYKIEVRVNAHSKARSNAEDSEFREYYGSRDSAYGHLLEKYLGELGYHKSINDFYYENQDTKSKTY